MTRKQYLDGVDRPQNPPANTPRLRLKPKAPVSGYVDGAWWPHNGDLNAELPDLLAVLSVRLGRISRVIYSLGAWADVPKKVSFGGHTVRLGGFRFHPADTIEVLGFSGSKIVLLVVPPHTDPEQAHAVMMTAASPNNVLTVEDLLLVAPDSKLAPA